MFFESTAVVELFYLRIKYYIYLLLHIMSSNKVIVLNSFFYKFLDSFIYFLESDISPKRDIPIYLYDCTDNTFPSKKDPFILYNCEQLTIPSKLETLLTSIKINKPTELWDYSQVNITILQSHGVEATLIPIESPQWYIDKLLGWRKNRIIYDFGFCGSVSPKREFIVRSLQKKGFSFLALTNVWGEDRDKQLAKCHIMINIHVNDEYNVFESARCEPWLKAGVPVISETSLDDDPRCITVEYDKLIETAIDTIKIIKSSIE